MKSIYKVSSYDNNGNRLLFGEFDKLKKAEDCAEGFALDHLNSMVYVDEMKGKKSIKQWSYQAVDI